MAQVQSVHVTDPSRRPTVGREGETGPGRQPQQKPAAGYPRLLTLFPNAKTGDTVTSVNDHHFAFCKDFNTVAKEGEHK